MAQPLKEYRLLDGIMRKAHRNRPLTEAQTKRNRYLIWGLGSKIYFKGFSRNIFSSILYKSSCL